MSRDKNQYTRVNCSEYLLIIAVEYPEAIIEKNLPEVLQAMLRSIKDSNPDVRKKSRLLYLVLKHSFSKAVEQSIVGLEAGYLRALQEEAANFEKGSKSDLKQLLKPTKNTSKNKEIVQIKVSQPDLNRVLSPPPMSK